MKDKKKLIDYHNYKLKKEKKDKEELKKTIEMSKNVVERWIKKLKLK